MGLHRKNWRQLKSTTIIRNTSKLNRCLKSYSGCTMAVPNAKRFTSILLIRTTHLESIYLLAIISSIFSQTYALSPKREEAAYMHGICEFQKSMAPELDQTPTKEAINSLQAFINQYPNSKYVDDCNAKIDELRNRILLKVYNSAKLYYHLGQYKSAIVACTNALDDYPDMINREELGYIIVESAYNYAKNSVKKMQEERYNETLTAIKTFYKEYKTDGSFVDDVKKIEEKTTNDLEELKQSELN